MTTYTASASASPITVVSVPAGTYTAAVVAHNSSGNSVASSTVSVTVGAPPTGGTNLLPNVATQHASTTTQFTVGGNCTIAVDNTVFEEGNSSIKVTTTASGALPYFYPTSPSADGAPVTAGSQYTAFASFKPTTTTNTFGVVISWYNTSNVYISQTAGSATSCPTGTWTEAICTGTAPTGATRAIIQPQAAAAMGAIGDSFNVDELAIMAGTATIWSATG